MKKNLTWILLLFIGNGLFFYGFYGCTDSSTKKVARSSARNGIPEETKCEAGFYKNSSSQECIDVEEGFISNENSNEQTQCSGNTHPNSDSSVCVECPDSYHANSVNGDCEANIIVCPIANGRGTQTWDDTNNVYTACTVTSCHRSYYKDNTNQCVSVSGAYISLAGSTERTACSGSTVPNTLKNACITCPMGQAPNSSNTDCACASLSCATSLTLDTLEEISVFNASTYTLKGTCSENGQPVQISINTSDITTSVNCTNNSWEVALDLTALSTTPPSLQVQHKKSSETTGVVISKASSELTYSFNCPTDYIPVPRLEGYTSRDFCVSQFEEKKDPRASVVKPYVEITHTNSRAYCQNKTTRGGYYDLISNDQWQTLARNIEKVAENWENGSIGTTALNQGAILGTNAELIPIPKSSQEKNNPCYETGATCDFNTWHKYRRTHKLSNGQIIWDLSGNAGEWIREIFGNTSNYSHSSYISVIKNDSYKKASKNPKKPSIIVLKSLYVGNEQSRERIVDKKTFKELFGPAGDMSAFSTTPFAGLGYASFADKSTATVRFFRGGHNQRANPVAEMPDPTQHGIFSLERRRFGARPLVSLRCVFNPDPVQNPCHAIHAGGSASCTQNLARFYYDQSQNKCASFNYSGCGGNSNNFQTELDCLRTCKKW